MNVGDVRNRNQPNVLNVNSSVAQHLEGRMGSRLCKCATGLAIVGMPSASNHGQPLDPLDPLHAMHIRTNNKKYFLGRTVILATIYATCFVRLFSKDPDYLSAMLAGAAVWGFKEITDWFVDYSTLYWRGYNKHRTDS